LGVVVVVGEAAAQTQVLIISPAEGVVQHFALKEQHLLPIMAQSAVVVVVAVVVGSTNPLAKTLKLMVVEVVVVAKGLTAARALLVAGLLKALANLAAVVTPVVCRAGVVGAGAAAALAVQAVQAEDTALGAQQVAAPTTKAAQAAVAEVMLQLLVLAQT